MFPQELRTGSGEFGLADRPLPFPTPPAADRSTPYSAARFLSIRWAVVTRRFFITTSRLPLRWARFTPHFNTTRVRESFWS